MGLRKDLPGLEILLVESTNIDVWVSNLRRHKNRCLSCSTRLPESLVRKVASVSTSEQPLLEFPTVALPEQKYSPDEDLKSTMLSKYK